MSGLPTASAIERAMACADSMALPQAFSGGPYAARGSGIGAFVRRVLGGMAVAASAALEPEEWRATCLGLDFNRLCGDLSLVRGEMAYALDVNAMAVRELGSNLGRRYPAGGPSEIMGTNDVEGMRFDGVPVAIDLKSGQPVTPAAENPQILFHAACRYLVTGESEIEGRVAYVAEDGAIDLDCATFDAFALESFVDDLGVMVKRVHEAHARIAAGGRAIVSAGAWCKYCPAMVACPQYTALARCMLSEQLDVEATISAMAPEQLGRAWMLSKQIETLNERVLDGLKAIVRQSPGGIPLDNGQHVRVVPWSSTRFDQKRAVAMLRELGAPEEAIAGLRATNPSEQIRAVGKRRAS